MNRTQFATIALWTGLVLIALAIVSWIYADGFLTIWLGTIGVLALAGTIFERVRYKEIAPTPPLGHGWTETQERFRDPATNRWVQVYFRPDTGERRYVESPPPAL